MGAATGDVQIGHDAPRRGGLPLARLRRGEREADGDLAFAVHAGADDLAGGVVVELLVEVTDAAIGVTGRTLAHDAVASVGEQVEGALPAGVAPGMNDVVQLADLEWPQHLLAQVFVQVGRRPGVPPLASFRQRHVSPSAPGKLTAYSAHAPVVPSTRVSRFSR